ncbi:UBC-like protein [Phellopilus nigrolimitatus]|nr:UBC-like protein [Phellopilus nigrolimitatus]KAH8111995.1 UBC-like protein [Phellopilus nigrolimitatus]
MDAERLLATSEVAMEYAALKHDDHCPKGMYLIPSTETILAWDGVLFVHQGYYADSILKFRIRFPFTYPTRAPTVTFATDVFHPLISQEDGTLNVAPRFSPWRPKQDHVFHLLHWIKVVFKKETLDNLKESDCLNKEAFR